jgi:hypothetical protein
LPRYKHISVGSPVNIDELVKPRERQLSARQLALVERAEEIRRALNEVATAPASQAFPIVARDGQKIANLRAAITKQIKVDGRAISLSVRGNTIYLSRGKLPRSRAGAGGNAES